MEIIILCDCQNILIISNQRRSESHLVRVEYRRYTTTKNERSLQSFINLYQLTVYVIDYVLLCQGLPIFRFLSIGFITCEQMPFLSSCPMCAYRSSGGAEQLSSEKHNMKRGRKKRKFLTGRLLRKII